jgi:hypothetical protein
MIYFYKVLFKIIISMYGDILIYSRAKIIPFHINSHVINTFGLAL